MEINPLYLLSAYGFKTNVPYQSSTVTMKAVTTAIKDGISIDSDGNLVVEGVTVGTVEAGSQITDVTLDGNDNLVITYVIEDGTTKTITTSLAKLVDVYKGGEGINVEDNTISINDDDVATQAELDAVQTQVTELQDTAITKETADETYQPKGTYVSDVALETTDNNVYTLKVDGEEKGGFTLPDTENLATQEEVTTLSAVVENNAGQIASLQAMVDVLTAKVDALSQTNTVPVDLSNLTGDLTDTTADYVLSGTLSSTVTVTGKSITLDDTVVIGNDNRLNLKANDVTINGSTISGEYVKANGNSVIKIDECENVVIQNLTFDDTYSGYNGVEIGLSQSSSTYPKNILVDGCEIGGTFSNNAINVYATADNATVTISNCHFVDVSNCLRISNTTKATGVTFNVVNCTVDQWEHKEDNEAYYGFFLGQDYTSSSDEEAIANNLFGQDKITLNFTDLTHAGEKVCPADPYSVCGVDDGTQVVYTYADKHGKWYAADNKEMYPVVTFA